MQKLIIYIFPLIFFTKSTAQQLINGDFNQWSSIINNGNRVDYPINWTLYSISSQTADYNGDRVRRPNRESSICIRAYSEPGSIFQYDNTSYLSYGEIVGKKNEIKPEKWGVPHTSRPTKVKGEYKFYNKEFLEDAGYAYILLRKYNTETQRSDTIGFGEHTFPVNAKDLDPWISGGYEGFEIDIEYRDILTQPDSLVLAFVNSKYQEFISFNKYAGGLFFIDNVSLVESPASLSDASEAEISLTLHPNPANEMLNIGNAKDYEQFTIYHSTGQKVVEIKATESVDVSALPVGLYLLEAIDSKGYRVVKKFEKR